MKLSIGGLAAALALGMVAVTATPQVTMAQAVAEVKKHKSVRYQWVIEDILPFKRETDMVTKGVTLEDLTKYRMCDVQLCTQNGGTQGVMVAMDGAAKRFMSARPIPASYAQALNSGVADTPVPKEAFIGVIPKADLAVMLAKPNVAAEFSKVVTEGGKDFPKGASDKMLTQKTLLERIQALADSKASTTTTVQLDGKPAVKIDGSEDKKRVTVWLDPKTRLPLRIEHVSHVSDKIMFVQTGFVWDPELPAGLTPDMLFSTEPPKGYPLTIVVE